MLPGKRIVDRRIRLAERRLQSENAMPGPFEQAVTLRNFVSRAEAIGNGIQHRRGDRSALEVRRGRRRSVLGNPRRGARAQIRMVGPGRLTRPTGKLATIALLVGVLMSLPILRLSEATVMQSLMLSAAANGVGAWVATVFAYWNGHYFVFGSAFALTLGLILLVPLVLIAMAADRGNRRRCIWPEPAPAARQAAARGAGRRGAEAFPKVSIHVPAYFEPPEMLKQTLDAVSRLDYPNFECVVIINNTPDPDFWQPIQDHCRALGRTFQVHQCREGSKASRPARCASPWTAPAADAEIIGIIDCRLCRAAGMC